MKAADLKERIKIYRLYTTATVYGDTHDEYKFNYSCRARVNYASGNRTIQNDAIFYSVDREFIVRSYVPVKDTDIIIWNDALYIHCSSSLRSFRTAVFRRLLRPYPN